VDEIEISNRWKGDFKYIVNSITNKYLIESILGVIYDKNYLNKFPIASPTLLRGLSD
jgi:hypothetical protein